MSSAVIARLALGTAKLARDVVADAFAASILCVPVLERGFRRLRPQASWPGLVHVFYRRTRQSVTQRLRCSDRRYQRLDVGRLPMIMDVTEFTCNGLYFGGVAYEPQTTACLTEHLREGNTFVDVGANHGYFSVMAALLVGPAGRVFAFEPNPAVLEQLRRHVAMNAVRNVAIEPLALADVEETEVDLYVSGDDANSGLSSITLAAGGFGAGHLEVDRRIRVPATTFDAWARGHLDRPVDLMKIDVEASEERVIRGMSVVLATRPPARIICEMTPRNPAHDLLLERGYAPLVLEETAGYRNILYTHRDA